MSTKINTPKDLLLGYQRKWVDDMSRFKMGLWARQTGKDFSSSEEAIEDCLEKALRSSKTEWTVFAAGERQAIESMNKAKDWAEAYKIAIEDFIEERNSVEALLKSAEIRFGGGPVIRALPANPDTARGYSSNIIITEFDFIERQQEFWRAIYPIITNPLRGGEKKLRIITTPNGKNRMGYKLWTGNNSYSKHKVTIYDAVEQGLPVNIEELKAGLDDPDGWAQEYLCEFIDTAAILLPYELISTCESEEATEALRHAPYQSENPLFCGIDIGRKHDLTVCWTLEKIGDVLWTREVLALDRLPYHQQYEILSPRISEADNVAIDATGIGSMLAEELARLHGEYKVEECTFSNAFKNEIYLGLRRKFEDKLIRVPVARVIREDFHGLHKVTTASGSIKFAAPHTDDGHCDRATAAALAVYAAGEDNDMPGCLIK